MPRFAIRPILALAVTLLCLAGCAPLTTQTTTVASATSAAISTSTPSPATAQTAFTCPVTVAGAQNVFNDPTTGLRFSFPASWTEHDCVRATSTTGVQSIQIGNLFVVVVTPRNGLTIAQWVNQQADPQNEEVTLGPLTVAHAVEAETVSATPSANANPSVPFDREPFNHTSAIVAGSQQFYEISPLTAQKSMTDTLPGLSSAQLTEQVIPTFDVP